MDNINTFISKAQLKFSDKFSYSKSMYTRSKDPITITCPIHGDFETTPHQFLQSKCGCPKCGKEYRESLKYKTLEQFIKEAKQIHGNKFSYEESEYNGCDNEIIITCNIHGAFKSTPSRILRGCGCPKCKGEVTKNFNITNKRDSNESFITKIEQVYGKGIFLYDKLNYINSRTDVILYSIISQEYFSATPSCILQKKIKSKYYMQDENIVSKGEYIIEKYLKDSNIKYISQYEIDIDKNINPSGKAYIDFYLPEYNIAIEYNGIQHYKPIYHFGGDLVYNSYQVPRDNYIHNYCKTNNITLLIYKYDIPLESLSNIINKDLNEFKNQP